MPADRQDQTTTLLPQPMDWLAWCAELVELGGDRYGPRGVIEECGSGCWQEYFEMGYSPADALSEDAICD